MMEAKKQAVAKAKRRYSVIINPKIKLLLVNLDMF